MSMMSSSPPKTARAPIPDYLEQVSKAVVAAGARTVNIPDTVGYSTPDEYGELIGRVVQALGDTAVVSVHCHDDLGLAVANSLAAVKAGARQIECTINGIGERAGNCSLEEIVMVMKTRNDRYPYSTGIHPEHLFPCSQMLSSIISFGPQPNKAIVGRNAFAHEAGIHQDGFLKERTTYEIIGTEIGRCSRKPPGAGKAQRPPCAQSRSSISASTLAKDELDLVYQEITALADNKKGLMDEEIAVHRAPLPVPDWPKLLRQVATSSQNAKWRLSRNLNLNVLVLPGDGIGTEVTREAVRVMRIVAAKWKHQLNHHAKDCWAASPFTKPAAPSRRKPKSFRSKPMPS